MKRFFMRYNALVYVFKKKIMFYKKKKVCSIEFEFYRYRMKDAFFSNDSHRHSLLV